MAEIRLDDIGSDDPEIAQTFRKWREAIEGAHRWLVSGAAAFTGGLGGYALHIKSRPTEPITATVAAGGIAARVSANVLGEGLAVLKVPGSGPNMTDAPGDPAHIYNSFSVDIPEDTSIEVLPYNGGYKVVGADCVVAAPEI